MKGVLLVRGDDIWAIGGGGGSGFDLRGYGIERRFGTYVSDGIRDRKLLCLRLTGHGFSQEGEKILRYCTNPYVGSSRHSFRARKIWGHAKSICKDMCL